MQFVDDYQGVLTVLLLAFVIILLVLRRPGAAPKLDEGRARLEEQLRTIEEQSETLRRELESERIARGQLETTRDGLASRVAEQTEQIEALTERETDLQRDLGTLKVAESRLTSMRDALESRIAEQAEQIEVLTARSTEFQRDLGALKIAESRLASECDSLNTDGDRLRSEKTALEERLEAALEAVKERDRKIGALNGNAQELTATLAAERDKHAKLLAETEKNRADFLAQFKAISGEILQNQGRATTEAQKSELQKIITPFKVEIEGLKTNLKDLTEKAEKERQTLGSQLLVMQSRAAELAEEANGLARALRGDSKRQGNWGETILERILEAAGLQEGTHFTRQAETRTADGARLIPDIILHLPGERDVVIDSKVTLTAYQDLVQADDSAAEAAALKRHLQAVRAHVRSLADKDYAALGRDSFGSVMMFLPVEGALSAALAEDDRLVVEAAERRVHLMTPTTLMPVLQIVEHLWTIDSRNRNVDEIVERAGRLHDKFVSVVESIQKIGDHLKRASDSHSDALKQMSEGHGNVLRQMDLLRQLGARTRKTLPTDLLTDDESEEEPASEADNSSPALTAS